MKRLFLLLVLTLTPVFASAEVFQIQDIRIDGLQRVSAGTVFASLPIGVGDLVDEKAVRNATRALFRTGYFDDIKIGRDGDVLIVVLKERPAISVITIEGNKSIETDQLLKALRENGLAEGQIFREAILESMSQELQRQYVAQGRYGAQVKTEVKELPRNRTAIHLNIEEGDVAKIKHINIVGNRDFEEDELLDNFELETTGWLSWISSDDKYSKEKLTGDLERLESWYLDRGYLKFSVNSTQVAISPDKESVYITVNLTEGEVYKVDKVDFAGDLILPEEDIRRLVLLTEEKTFSQILMTKSSEFMTQRLGNEGYTFAEVKGYPKLNEEEKTAAVTFFVNPGKRAYVRRIEFRGNTKTADEVLRREMRQMEGASASTALIERSKLRLERLGFFKDVQSETRPVAGTNDQLDVIYTVEEQPSGSVGASVGFSQGFGLVLGANLQENNFLGSGKRVGVGISNSDFRTSLSFNYTDPYFTKDGVSAGFNIFFRNTDFEEANLSSFTTDSFGANVNYSYPLSETERFGFGFGYENLKIETGSDLVLAADNLVSASGAPLFIDPSLSAILDDGSGSFVDINENGVFDSPPDDRVSFVRAEAPFLGGEIQDFIETNGDSYNLFTVNLSWVQSTLNRGIFATRGSQQRVNVDVSFPGSDLEYYLASYSAQHFRPLTDNLTLRLRGELGYGDGFGGTDRLPFFRNYYAGGFGSVRGFERNTLGPRETPPCVFGGQPEDYLNGECTLDDADPLGGNVLVTSSAEIIFPLPFIKDQRSVQASFFLDAGNVFDTDCGSKSDDFCSEPDLGELRYSIGIGATWLSGFGPLTFSLAKPLNAGSEDEEEVFQFSLGQTF